jgi:hypothetical protein
MSHTITLHVTISKDYIGKSSFKKETLLINSSSRTNGVLKTKSVQWFDQKIPEPTPSPVLRVFNLQKNQKKVHKIITTGNRQFAVGQVICRVQNIDAHGKLIICRTLLLYSRQIACLPCVSQKPTANNQFAVFILQTYGKPLICRVYLKYLQQITYLPCISK